MTKIIFLLPPSEGKNPEGKYALELLSYDFVKPKKIAINATEKDLKCKDKRYEEGITLNKQCVSLPSKVNTPHPQPLSLEWEGSFLEAIQRYSGVMYNAIGYESMFETGKQYFQEHVLILSGMYGIVRPKDIIANYKLPIETKWLVQFWWESITEKIKEIAPDAVVNLLPLSYQKMIDFQSLDAEIINVNFYTKKDWELKKMTHGVKKVKGEWLREICERWEQNYHNFWGIVSTTNTWVEIQIIKS